MADNNLGDLNSILHIKTDPSEIAAAQQQLNAIFGTAQQGLNTINDGIAKIQKVTSLGILGGGLAGIVHQVFQTRSYFQDAASSMKTFLGDADKAAKFTKELQDYAFYNMYEFQDLVGVSKQLIAYGTTDTKEIIKVTDQLSNIATGTGANINEMVYIYNKIKAQGKLQGDELNQLASRGLVVKDVLKEMGETVNGNNVTFEQFQKVLTHVTSEGGMFHDLMKDQLNNLSASAAQLSDNMTNLWNTVGETLEPVMKEAIDLAGFLIEKGTEGFESIQAYLFDIAKAYGIYKVVDAGMSWNAENKEQERAKSVEMVTSALEEAAEATKNVGNEDLQAQVKKKRLTQEEANEIAQLRKQVAEENKARIAKGDLTKEEAKKIAATKEGLKIREIELKKMQEQAAKEVAAINEEIAALEKRNKLAQSKVSLSPSTGGNAAAIAAETDAMRLKELQLQRTAAQERQTAAATGIATIQQAQNTAALAQNEKARGFWARGMTAAGSALKSIGSSIVEMINPTGMLIAAVGFLVEEFAAAAIAGSQVEQANDRLEDSITEFSMEVNKELQQLQEYSETIKKAGEDTQLYKDAKEGLYEMAERYNLQTTETVDGITKEIDAVDLVTKKYDEFKNKIEETYKYKAFTAFVQGERQIIDEETLSVTKTLREQMEDAILDGVKDSEKAAKRVDIQMAVSEIQAKLLEGSLGYDLVGGKFNIKGLSAETQAIMDEYQQNIGVWQDFKNYTVGNFKALKAAFSGDIGWTDEINTDEMGKSYGNFILAMAIKRTQASQEVIKEAEQRYGLTEQQKTSGGNDGKTAQQSVAYQIKRAKEDAKKYIEEYAKIMNDFRKEKRKIDTDVNMSDEERATLLAKLDTNTKQSIAELDSQYAARIKDPKKMEALRTAYQTAADVEIETARAQNVRVQGEIAKLQKQAEDLQSRQGKDPNDPSKKATDAQQQADTATINKIQERIALLTAEAEGYQKVIDTDKEWDKNFKRIHEITKQENDKFLDDQVKKQRDIAENYKKLRKELYIMLEDEQISNEQYNQLLFQTNLNEEKARQQEYINIYGGYYAKREELMRVWEQRLANVPPEYFNVAKQKMVEELSKMDFSQFKENLNWDAIFGDLSKQTAKTLAQNLEDLKAAFDAQKGSMGIDEIKTVQDAIGKLNDELAKRNPWKAMAQAAKDLKDAHKNIPELEEKQAKARQKLAVAQSNYDYALAERQRIEDNVAAGIMTQEQAAQELVSVNGNLAAATKELNDAEVQLKNTNDELNAENEKAAKAQLRLGEGWKQVGGYISEAGSALSKIGDALGEDGAKLKEIGDVMSTIGSTLTQTIQNLGNPTAAISQAINATVQMISNIIASRRKAKKEQEDWAKSQRQFVENMRLSEIESERLRTKDSGNWAADYLSQASDAAQAYADAQSELNKKIQELAESGKAKKGMREGLDWGTVGKNTALGAGAGAAIGSIIPGVGTAIGAAVGAVVGTVGGFISGLFSKKNKNIWGDLLTQYPELVETAANGEERINTALADQLIEQGILNDKTKELVEEAKKYQEEMDAAREQIEEIADSLMGSLGNNLRSALVDAFTEGTDAAEALHKTVNATLEDMVSQLLYGARLAPIFEKIKTAMADSLQYGGGALDMIDIISDNYAELQAASEQMTDDLQTVQEYAEKKGWDLFKGEAAERNAVSGGIANVTQDTAEEMNGRLTQIQSHTFAINENMRLMVNMQTTQLAILQGIHTDTGQLHAIRADMATVKATLSDIQTRGLKLKE